MDQEALNNQRRQDRERLLQLTDALDSTRQLQRDDCGDYCIEGRTGKIYHAPPGFLLVVYPGSTRGWNVAKAQLLEFCTITQDGEDEGCLRMQLSFPKQHADLVRRILHLRKRRILSEERRMKLQQAGAKYRFKSA